MPAKACSTRGPDSPVLGVVGFLVAQQGPAGAIAVRDDEDGVDVSAVSEDGHARTDAGQAGCQPIPIRNHCLCREICVAAASASKPPDSELMNVSGDGAGAARPRTERTR